MNRHLLIYMIVLMTTGFTNTTLANPKAGPQQSSVSSDVQFVDLLWLKPGVEADSAGHYFSQLLTPVLQRHGGKVLYVYRIDAALKGSLKPAINASLTFPSMEALQAMFQDPEYQKIIPVRDSIFDFTQQSLWQVTPLE